MGRDRRVDQSPSVRLYRIAVQTIADHSRSWGRAESGWDDAPELVGALPTEGGEGTQRIGASDIRILVESLPDQPRVALTLKFGAGLRMAAIAAILDTSEEAARLLVVQATATLHQRLRRECRQDTRDASAHG